MSLIHFLEVDMGVDVIADLELTLDDLQRKIDYYESLIDYLDDMVPCLDELIIQFNEGEDD